MNKVYEGLRDLDGFGCHIIVRDLLSARHFPLPLEPSLKLYNHSPTGFEWGYGGSGPAQLALAILLDHIGDKDLALTLHEQFKWDVIAKLPRLSKSDPYTNHFYVDSGYAASVAYDWQLTSAQIQLWLNAAQL